LGDLPLSLPTLGKGGKLQVFSPLSRDRKGNPPHPRESPLSPGDLREALYAKAILFSSRRRRPPFPEKRTFSRFLFLVSGEKALYNLTAREMYSFPPPPPFLSPRFEGQAVRIFFFSPEARRKQRLEKARRADPLFKTPPVPFPPPLARRKGALLVFLMHKYRGVPSSAEHRTPSQPQLICCFFRWDFRFFFFALLAAKRRRLPLGVEPPCWASGEVHQGRLARCSLKAGNTSCLTPLSGLQRNGGDRAAPFFF